MEVGDQAGVLATGQGKQRIGGQSSAGSDDPNSEIGGGYIPKIHQPREAKAIEGGLVNKMNKLLDSKFQKMMGGGGSPSGPPGAPPSPRGVPPMAPPSARAPPSKNDKKKDKKKKDKKKNKNHVDSQLSAIERKIREKLG